MLKGLKKGGMFLLNCPWDAREASEKLPDTMKKYLAVNNINFFIIDATKVADEIGLGNRTNTIMQAAFFKIANVIPYDLAVKEMKRFIVKSFGRKGEEIVAMNNAAVDRGGEVMKVAVPESWAKINIVKETDSRDLPDFIKNVVEPINMLRGDDLPVSVFVGREDGTFPAGTTQYEKRGIAVTVPEWQSGNCIQCNQCSYVCPHAAIRPFLLDEKEMKSIPSEAVTVSANGKSLAGLQYKIQVSVLDCTGCGNCADVCPSKEKALIMKPLESQTAEIENWNYLANKVSYKETLLPKDAAIKNTQFAKPLFEFSGACAGCGETPYIKLITQLYGDRMMVANATGCSSIYGGSAPSTPYCINSEGQGPAWANSLFEDNAEYGFGMATGINQMRDRISMLMKSAIKNGASANMKAAFESWLASKDKANESKEATKLVIAACEKEKNPVTSDILKLKQYLIKKSVWIFGGDGWAYDIGYGGLDHVLASGEDVNVLVVDTEVYSNTGGQSSKATPTGAVAKFATSGKKIRKKDLGMMAMSYGYVYVAQVGMGANQAQYLKALREAEAYPGPSLIIAYSPCINHGLRAGMGASQKQQKHAVDSGYWQLYRYNPMLETEGQNPFQLDSKEPDWTKFREFLNSEVRYTSLQQSFPAESEELFAAAEENAKWRYKSYQRLANQDFKIAEK